MVGIRIFRAGISVVTLSLILLITASNSLPNGLTPAYGLRLSSVGDWGCNSNTDNTVENILNHNAPTTLSLGDNSYQDTAKCWFNAVEPIDGDADPTIPKKVKITIGNHDDTSSSLLNSYKDHFNLNKLYYSFNRGGGSVHVLVMNSEDPNRSDKNSDQYKFVKSDLESAHNNPSIKWIIVEVHQPFFTSPNGCSASSCKGSKSFTQTYQPLFDQNKVDLVLFGHVHNYQRTTPVIFKSSDPLKPTKTTNERCDYTNPTGTIYAIVGTGGINFHSLDPDKKAYFVAVQQASRFGQLDISFNSDGSKLTGQFFSNEPGTAGKCLQSSTILDRFTITKSFAASSLALPTKGLEENKGESNLLFELEDNPFG